jgi:hypothetical protein
MPITTVQYRFTAGELDPQMIGRSDLEKYYGAASSLLNCWAINQGGIKRRPGLEYIDRLHRQMTRESAPTITATNGGVTAQANDDNTATVLLTTTNISTTNPYVVVHYDLGSVKSIGFADIVGATLTAGTSTEFFIQYSTDNAAWTSAGSAIPMSTTAVTLRRRIRTTARYLRFVRIGATDLGTAKAQIQEFSVYVESASLSESRLMPFEFSVTQSYMMVFTDKNIAVYKDGVFQVDIRATLFTSSLLSQIHWAQKADTGIVVHEDIPPHEIQRQGADDVWTFVPLTYDYVPKYDFVPVTSNPAGSFTPSAKEGSITITGVGTAFDSTYVNQYVDGNGGRARIVSVTSATVATAVTNIPFYNTNSIATGAWELLSGYEDVWSSTRGYPKTVTFHEGRLWFGGSRTRPQTIWGSRVGEFYNFDPGAVLDDDAIDATLDTNQLNSITNLISQKTLIVLTIGGEFVVPINSLEEAITPATVAFRKQSTNGSKQNLRAALLDNGTIYVQRGGSKVNEFRYLDESQEAGNSILSLLSGHLIGDPVDMAARQGTSQDDSGYLVLVNTDGTMTVACVLVTENIIAFTPTVTDGLFKNVGVDVEDIYAVAERTINSTATRYLERFNNERIFDSSIRYESGTTTFAVAHLEAETVKVRADDSLLGDEVVASGSVTIDRARADYVELGLNFDIEIIPLPVEIPRLGPLMGRRKRISEVILQLYETQDVVVNGNQVSFRGFGESGGTTPLDSAPPFFTGVKLIRGLRGWGRNGQVTITQSNPSPLTLTALGLKVGV